MEKVKIRNLNHGRETYAVYYGDGYVLKRPLPNMGDEAKNAWLAKQHKTQEAINLIRDVQNPTYNVPKMVFINDDEFQILEERALGFPLTRDLYRCLSRRQQYEIINSIGAFLVDMNELKPVGDTISHKIAEELKFNRLNRFIDTKMPKFFNKNEVRQMDKLADKIGTFEYQTFPAWCHCDLNPGNVLYDPNTSKLSFIDFAEANYRFVYRDIFASLQVELDICKQVYEVYTKLHNKQTYSMPSIKNDKLREIMMYRIMVIWLKRFIKAADDLRIHPKDEKSINNNECKVTFMREQLINFQNLQRKMLK
ncbi:MAG: aminoglycoside phosphotransferase family protein [Alphaproteobacteria bacterium]|nr:aminoglycoside phosphotransferase family protein [Alphaproteobacteria bacterium]